MNATRFEPAVHLTSLLAQTEQAGSSAREFLGREHPLVRVLQQTSSAMLDLVIVTLILVLAGGAWVDGANEAPAVVAAAAIVEAIVALRIGYLRWLARERACDLIVQGRADLPLDAVRRRRRRLLDREHREDLADGMDRTWSVAEASHGFATQAHPPLNARVIVAVRPELEEIAGRLREDAPGVRGVALVERLVSEGGSPLHGGSVPELRQELRRIEFMLGA